MLEPLVKRLLKIRLVYLIVRTFEAIATYDITDRAAAIAYYALLSIFPLLLGVVAIIGLFLPSAAVQEAIHAFFQQNFPISAELLEKNINEIIEMRGTLGFLSILGLFWTGSSLFASLNRSINRVCGLSVHQQPPFHKRKMWEIFMSLGIIILFIFSWGISSIISFLPYTAMGQMPLNLLMDFIGFTLFFIIVSLIYKFIPNCRTYWRYVLPGALLAAFLLEGSQALFSIYIHSIANFQLVYGSAAVVIAFLLWVYFSALAVIIGAEFTTQCSQTKV